MFYKFNGGGQRVFLLGHQVGATAAQSIYYFPKSDHTAGARHTAVEAGSMRGYGIPSGHDITELMVDELAVELVWTRSSSAAAMHCRRAENTQEPSRWASEQY